MLFNSFTFAIFFALFLPAFWLAPARWRNHLLIVGSYVFYGWWDWRFLGLIVISTIVDFTLGQIIHRTDNERRRLGLLWVSVLVNLGILGFFKYFNFFVDSAADLLEGFGLQPNTPTLEVLLPVGISFYTFQTISYSFDIFRRRIEPTRDIVTFGAYVAYFPQLVAGPIERARDLLPQLVSHDRPPPGRGRITRAATLILLGLVRKIVIADGIAHVVNDAYSNAETAGWFALLLGVLGFSLQIYGDFAGYTDIARGVSLLLGIELSLNFRQPYLSRNLTEFWRRWHVSLSNWLRDYLYIPLGGNRGSQLTTMRNLMLTMVLGGLWHGASFNFVIWGFLHGLVLGIHRWGFGGNVADRGVERRDLPAVVGTFALVTVIWIFFRAETLGDSFDVLQGLVTLRGGSWRVGDLALLIALGALSFALDFTQRQTLPTISNQLRQRPEAAAAAVTAAITLIVIFSGGAPEPFIYFQF